MRLIDADALNKELQQRVGSPTDDKLYEANLVIIEATTINAIPVEWLEEQADYARSEWDYDTCEGIRIVLKAWQEEQEAR